MLVVRLKSLYESLWYGDPCIMSDIRFGWFPSFLTQPQDGRAEGRQRRGSSSDTMAACRGAEQLTRLMKLVSLFATHVYNQYRAEYVNFKDKRSSGK